MSGLGNAGSAGAGDNQLYNDSDNGGRAVNLSTTDMEEAGRNISPGSSSMTHSRYDDPWLESSGSPASNSSNPLRTNRHKSSSLRSSRMRAQNQYASKKEPAYVQQHQYGYEERLSEEDQDTYESYLRGLELQQEEEQYRRAKFRRDSILICFSSTTFSCLLLALIMTLKQNHHPVVTAGSTYDENLGTKSPQSSSSWHDDINADDFKNDTDIVEKNIQSTIENDSYDILELWKT